MYIYKSNNGDVYFGTSEVVNCENIELICTDPNDIRTTDYKKKLDNMSKKDRMRIWEFLTGVFKYIEKVGIIETEEYNVWFEKTDQPNKHYLTLFERSGK